MAISLLSSDIGFGERLEGEVRKVVRGEVFLYKNRQEELALTGDLITEFSRVFGGAARIVVILHRPGWGATPFTSVEHDAIKGRRARSTDLQWLVVVSLEAGSAPEWYPAHEFRPDLTDGFTEAQVAGTIASRVHGAGGTIGKETPLELARRLQRQQAIQDDLAQIFRAESKEVFEREHREVFRRLKKRSEELSEALPEPVTYAESRGRLAVNYRWASIVLGPNRKQDESGNISEIGAVLLGRNTHFSGMRVGEPPRLGAGRFRIGLREGPLWGWGIIERLGPLRDFVTTDELVDGLLTALIERAHGKEPPVNYSAGGLYPG